MELARNPLAPRGARGWRYGVFGLVACLVIARLAPRLDRHVYLVTSDGVRATELAWARWTAERHGVEVLTRGTPLPGSRFVALTFDDGPHPKTCKAILEVLRREGVHATFFVVGTRARQHPGLLRRMLREGHEIGNHTWDHRRLIFLEPDKVRSELVSLQDLVARKTGFRPALCRPPGGTYDARVLEICRDEGFRICLWSVNAGDWRSKSADEIAGDVIDRVRPGAIVLMHDERMATPEALPAIIDGLRAQGYQFVTASEMVPDVAPPRPTADVARRPPGPGPHRAPPAPPAPPASTVAALPRPARSGS